MIVTEWPSFGIARAMYVLDTDPRSTIDSEFLGHVVSEVKSLVTPMAISERRGEFVYLAFLVKNCTLCFNSPIKKEIGFDEDRVMFRREIPEDERFAVLLVGKEEKIYDFKRFSSEEEARKSFKEAFA